MKHILILIPAFLFTGCTAAQRRDVGEAMQTAAPIIQVAAPGPWGEIASSLLIVIGSALTGGAVHMAHKKKGQP